ncbi:MAG: amidohydrolase [Rhodospirillaceae bacterium]|nr:amidohydrolase [Rhodospirillaceae bacterium]OUX31220.1 MAG: amidohydrolase [Rhodospirillaceae bacterium TMED256]
MNDNFDLVIRGGTVVDGTGGPAREADVAIYDGRITEVGKVSASGREEIDAKDRLVMPGFVDVHTHYDAQVTWANQILPSSCNGVTTVLMGNCGVGFAPVRPEHHDMLISLMEGVEDIPEVVMKEGLPWNWASFPDYLDSLDGNKYDVDVATQVPHAALRVFVMGERGANREEATAEDRAEMALLAAEGMRAGAFGFSTSRLLQHRTAEGEPIPSYGAAQEELMEIADALAEVGRGWIQTVGDFEDAIDAEFELRRQLAKRSGMPLTMTLLQKEARPDEWRDLLGRIEEANAEGLKITAQVRGRPTSVLLGFELSINPFSACPSWAQVKDLNFDARMAALHDPALRARLVSEPCGDIVRKRRFQQWDRIFPFGDPPQYEPDPETSVGKQAERLGVSPAELAYDLMLEEGGRAILYRPTTNYANGDLGVVHEMLDHPDTLIGLGDGGAHVGVMCDATDMAHTISYWTRDRTRGPKHRLEDMVRRLSSNNAEAIGLTDRGRIEVGLRADINIVDYDAMILPSPQVHYDLPAGGKRLLQQMRGIDATLLAGQPVWRNGEATGALPGRLLRSGT